MTHETAIAILRDANAACQLNEDELRDAESALLRQPTKVLVEVKSGCVVAVYASDATAEISLLDRDLDNVSERIPAEEWSKRPAV